jgi:8-oxo-dGTP pyrophosphatase MutT (NUDIX family)
MSKEQQNYEIYLNERVLHLIAEPDLANWKASSHQLVMAYRGQKKTLFQYLDILENSDRFQSIVLVAPDLNAMFEDLKSLLKWVPAAGGLIVNDKNELLMMFRRGFWDLPKGKLDEGERSKGAAIRECTEETGLQGLTITEKIGVTWHVYREKNKERALKKTKWYLMSTSGEALPVPQVEEGIEKLIWVDPELALQLKPLYVSLNGIIQAIKVRK